jgi:hypothetical protein
VSAPRWPRPNRQKIPWNIRSLGVEVPILLLVLLKAITARCRMQISCGCDFCRCPQGGAAVEDVAYGHSPVKSNKTLPGMRHRENCSDHQKLKRQKLQARRSVRIFAYGKTSKVGRHFRAIALPPEHQINREIPSTTCLS